MYGSTIIYQALYLARVRCTWKCTNLRKEAWRSLGDREEKQIITVNFLARSNWNTISRDSISVCTQSFIVCTHSGILNSLMVIC